MSEDQLTARVALYGRLADELTRQALEHRSFGASLAGTGVGALGKRDGYFVFSDLRPAPSPYELAVTASSYQARDLSVEFPTLASVEISLPGEDELYVRIDEIDLPQLQVRFDTIRFLPPIETGSEVMGPNGFSADLAAPLEGSDVQFAQLTTVAGLSAGDLLRFVRSSNLMMKPGPYYAFPHGTTLAVLRVAEHISDQPSLGDVTLEIDQINDQALNTSSIGGLDLHTVTLPGPPPATLVVGPDTSISSHTDARGYAVFYFPEGSPVTRLRVQVLKAGYAAATTSVDLVAGERTFQSVLLARL